MASVNAGLPLHQALCELAVHGPEPLRDACAGYATNARVSVALLAAGVIGGLALPRARLDAAIRGHTGRNEVVVYAFTPPAAAERLLQLDRRLRLKLGTAAGSVGIAGAIEKAKQYRLLNEPGTAESICRDVLAVDPDEGPLVLSTIHSAKGLEWPVVAITGLEDGLFPLSRALESLDGVEEERRLCYVGITRAREQLYLTNARFRVGFGGGSDVEP